MEDPVQLYLAYWYHDNRIERTYPIFSRQRPTVKQVLTAVGMGVEQWERAVEEANSDSPANDVFFNFHAIGQPAFTADPPTDGIRSRWPSHNGIILDGPYPVTEPLPEVDGVPWRDWDQDQDWPLGPWDMCL